MKNNFLPCQNRPSSLKMQSIRKNADWNQHLNYSEAAWFTYWQMLEEIKGNGSWWQAHKKIQQAHPFKIPEELKDEHLTPDDLIIFFMGQFEEWQLKSYDLTSLYSMPYKRFDYDIDKNGTLEEAFELIPMHLKSDFTEVLWMREHVRLLELLKDDPIFGKQAELDLFGINWRKNHKINEVCRRSQLPDNIQKIDQIISKGYPTGYNVHFPYHHPNHNVPNCLCVLGDGFPIFRLEVLDPEYCAKFRLAEMLPAWWRPKLFTNEDPKPKQYDFDFYEEGIYENDEFDIDKLLEIMEKSIEKIQSRSKPMF